MFARRLFVSRNFKRASRSQAKTVFLGLEQNVHLHASSLLFLWGGIRISGSVKNGVLLACELISENSYFLAINYFFGSTLEITVLFAWELNSGELNRHFYVFCDLGKCENKMFPHDSRCHVFH